MAAGFLEQELAYDLSQLIADQGMSIVIRNLTTLPGTPPYANPPQFSSLTVSGIFGIGASAVSLSGTLVNGRLIAGDQMVFGTDPTVYTVTVQNLAANNAFTGVGITPNLVQATTVGESIAFTFAADTTISALVTSFPSRLVNGTTILASDKQIRFLASGLSFTPTVTDKVFLFGEQYSIVQPRPVQSQGVIFAWACQVRK